MSIDNTAVTTEADTATAFDSEATVGLTITIGIEREGATLEVRATYGRQDPVLGALVDLVDDKDCAYIARPGATEAQRRLAFDAAFEGKRFNCDDAHQKLMQEVDGDLLFQPGDFIVIRGRRRVLLANAGWATVCIKAASYDGSRLTRAKVEALYEELAGDYVADRHANP